MSVYYIRSVLNTDVPTKKKAYLTFVIGDGMVNGLHTAFQVGHFGSIFDWETYIPVGDVEKCKRWDGIRMLEGGGFTYRYIYLNRLKNYRGEEEAGDQSTGNETMIGVDMYDSGDFSDGEVFLLAHTYINSTLVNGEQASSLIWSADDVDGLLFQFYKEADVAIEYLERMGYDVTLYGVNFCTNCFATGTEVAATYQSELEGLMANLRSRYADYNTGTIPFVLAKLDTTSRGAKAVAHNTGLAAISDAYMDYFDLSIMPLSSNLHHCRTITQRCFGRFCASGFYKLTESGTYPVVSNVAVSGTLQVGQAVTGSYNYTGATEGETEILVRYADDNSGTNPVYINVHRTGESEILTTTHLNKYIQVIVIPVSTESPEVGKALQSTWQGPVIAA